MALLGHHPKVIQYFLVLRQVSIRLLYELLLKSVSTYSNFSNSFLFQILNPIIEFLEGTSLSETVLLQPTIPIPCYGYPYSCSIQVRIVTRQSECTPIKKMQRETIKNDVLIDRCRFHISNENWNKTSNFNISWGFSGKYTAPPADLSNGYFIVQLETIGAWNTNLWDDYELPPIYVCTVLLHQVFYCIKYVVGFFFSKNHLSSLSGAI